MITIVTLVLLVSVLVLLVNKIPYRLFASKEILLFVVGLLTFLVPLYLWLRYVSTCQTMYEHETFFGIFVIYVFPALLFTTIATFTLGIVNLFRKRPRKWYFYWSMIGLLFVLIIFVGEIYTGSFFGGYCNSTGNLIGPLL